MERVSQARGTTPICVGWGWRWIRVGCGGIVTEQRLQRAMFVEGGSMAEEEDEGCKVIIEI